MSDRQSQCDQCSQYHMQEHLCPGRVCRGQQDSQAGASWGVLEATPGMQPPLLSLQQEPSEAPTPKRPRGRPKGSKNKATPKGRVGTRGWGCSSWGLVP